MMKATDTTDTETLQATPEEALEPTEADVTPTEAESDPIGEVVIDREALAAEAASPPAAPPRPVPDTLLGKFHVFLDDLGYGKLKPIAHPRTLAFLFLLLTMVLVGRFILFSSRGEFHSDTTDTIMWAAASYDSGSWLNPDFNYACFLPFGGQLIMLPLIAIFGVGMQAHVTGMLIFFLLFTFTLMGMFKQMGLTASWNCMSVSLILLALSCTKKMREIFWGHVIYYSLGMLFMFVGFLLLGKILSSMEASKRRKTYWCSLAVFGIWCCLTGLNQLTSLTLFGAPMIGALIAERFVSTQPPKTRFGKLGTFLIPATAIIGTLAGNFFGRKLTSGMFASYEDEFSSFSDPNTWTEHVQKLFLEFAKLLGAVTTDGQKIMSTQGITVLLKIVFAMLLVIAPIVLTCLYPKIKERLLRTFIWYHWLMTALIMMGYIFGKLHIANWRLTPIVCSSTIMTVLLAYWLFRNVKSMQRLAILFLVPVLIFSGLSAKEMKEMPTDNTQENYLYALSDALENEHLTYGYATFWNANALTVITDSKVHISNINLNETNYSAFRYQAENSWFGPQPDTNLYFVLLSSEEYNMISQNANHPLLQKSAYQKQIARGFWILYYSESLF